MTDIYDKKKRSEVMSAIKSKNSKAELIVFRYLRSRGIYFQKHYSRALGKPDIAIPRKKKAVFIDGDFWHGRTYEDVLVRYSHDSYWPQKIMANMQRDIKNRKILQDMGWKVLVVWESDIKRKRTQLDSLERIVLFLTTPSSVKEILSSKLVCSLKLCSD